MRQENTLTQKKKRKMHNQRQAVSTVLGTVVLISAGLILVATVASEYHTVSYNSLGCSIQNAKLVKISDSFYFGALQLVNDGNQIITKYEIKIVDGNNIYSVKDVDTNVLVGNFVAEEFEVLKIIENENILVRIVVYDKNSDAQCSIGVML